MRTARSLILLVLIFVALVGVVATSLLAQTSAMQMIRGQVSLNGGATAQGETVKPGDTIQTGTAAFAVVRVEWSVPEDTCFIEYMFGFGQRFKVPELPATRTCENKSETRYSGVSTKYGSAGRGKGDSPRGKAEAPTPPAYQEFDDLQAAFAAGMVLRQNESRRAQDYNLPGQKTPTAAACAALCARAGRCTAMTYIPDQMACWLKEQRGDAVAAPGMISAVKPVNPKAVVGRGQ